jgi:cell division protein FtsI/penicillin-binding protein 2
MNSLVCGLFCALLALTPDPFTENRLKIDGAIREFEREHPRCAAVIMKSKTARVMYLYNREDAVRNRFPPGSLAKVWSAVVLLEHAQLFGFRPAVTVNCRGKFLIPDSLAITRSEQSYLNIPYDETAKSRYYRCSRVHGRVNGTGALMHSCNVYFLTCSMRDPLRFYRLLDEKWHAGSGTGARLAGVVELPDRGRKDLPLFSAGLSAIGEGGGLMVSPLKMAQTYSAVFEGTPLLRPWEGDSGGPREQFPLEISRENRGFVLNALAGLLSAGTMKGLALDNPAVTLLGGKTGTGTHAGRKYATHGWNVIYFQYRGERYVMAVFVYRGSGAREAEDLSARILNALR